MYRGGPSAGEPVRPREMGVPSDDGEEAVAPRVPPVPEEPTQSTVPQAMQPIVEVVSIVSEVVDVCHFLKQGQHQYLQW